MRPKSIVLLVLALGCGLVASIGINQALSQPQQQVVLGETTPILVATLDINANELLQPAMVSLAEWPKDNLPQGALTDIAQLEGRRTRIKLHKGEPLSENKLTDGKTGALDELPPGMRTVPVKVDAVSGGAGLLKPGDHVDVLVHVAENHGRGILKPLTIAPKDLQNVKIFAIDSVRSRDGDGEQTVVAKTISLMVTPAQARLATLASELGQIRLVGRNARDNEPEQGDGESTVGVEDLLKGLGSSGGEPKDVVESIGQWLNKPSVEQPRPLPPEPQVPAAPAVERETMIIREGPNARQVYFENGKLIEFESGGAAAAPPQTSLELVDEPAIERTPPTAADEEGTTPSMR